MDKQWWKRAVVYQIYPKSFQDTNHDGIGDLQGIIRRLPYIKALGANVIWLCPINRSPMKDNGYDISDYEHIDPIFGNDADFEELLRQANSIGIKILMDLVVNHCSEEHPWFQAALKDPEGKFGKFFIIEDSRNGPPNNIRSYNGGSAWEKIEGTEHDGSAKYYFHVFSKEQPDLNWENPELRQRIFEMMNRWLDKGVAGFRIDAIGNIKKSARVFEHAQFPADGEDGLVSPEQFELVADGIEDYLSEMRNQVFHRHNSMTVAEVSVPEEKLETFIGENGFFSMVFDFSYTDNDVEQRNGATWERHWNWKEIRDKIFGSQDRLMNYGWGAPYLENHDQPRSLNKYIPVSEIGYESATALGMLYFFLRGTPFIYQGQELGMTNCPFPSINAMRDSFAISRYNQAEKEGENSEEVFEYLLHRGRDNARTPMQWAANAPNSGFSESEPWIMVNPNYHDINVEKEIMPSETASCMISKSGKSVWQFYHKMVMLRLDSLYSELLTFGGFKGNYSIDLPLICYHRFLNDQIAIILVNMSGMTKKMSANIKDLLDDSITLLNNYDEPLSDEIKPYQAVMAVKEVPNNCI